MLDTPFNFQPVIIIGAARSGTNMLRNLLTQVRGVETWPCDEINYIWRYGQAKHPTDELQPKHATPQNRKYIRRCFSKEAYRFNADWLIEKTCANSLRVEYLDQIIPEAKYLFLARNGFDVAASAEKRWHAPLDVRYLAQKAAYVPWRDIPYYGARYLGHRAKRFFNSERRLPTWGPRFSGMDEIVATKTPLEVCVKQWQQSVDMASTALSKLAPSRVHAMSYESFVQSPERELNKVFDFLGISCPQKNCQVITKSVSSRSVGIGREAMSTNELAKIESTVHGTHNRLRSSWNAFQTIRSNDQAA